MGIIKIIEAIQNFDDEDPKKRELAIHVIKFISIKKTRSIKLTVEEFADFVSVDESYLNQPFDTYQNPPGSAQLLGLFGLDEILIDENRYLSLLESTLMMLQSRKLLFNSSNNGFGDSIHLSGLQVFSSITTSRKEDELFPRIFEINLTDDFWDEINI